MHRNQLKNFFNEKHILVTGGAGFIGSHLCEQLVALGAYVSVLDNLSTGTTKNLTTIFDSITFIEGDITDKKTCIQATENIDIVFHCAALTSVPQSMENPQHCFNENIIGTFNILEGARINQVKRFVFSSSSAIYGPQENVCFEDMESNPISPYGTSKLVGEQLCKSYATYFNLSTICLRYFNVYGPRQNPNGPYAGVVAQFRERMKQNLPITIYGDGSQTRDFVPVGEVIRANLLLATLPKEHLVGQPVNVASGKSITLLELYEKLKHEFPHYTLKPQFLPARQSDIKHSAALCNRFNNLLQLTI